MDASPADSAEAIRSGVTASPGSEVERSHLSDETIVRGRLVEENGNPVSGASVVLFSMRGNWGHGYEGPSIKFLDVDVHGFQMTTAADGRFEFHTPLPTSDWISLRVEPTGYYGLEGRRFGPAGGRNQPRLILGLNDLGDLILPITGAVSGRVVASDGSKLAMASVIFDSRQAAGLNPFTSTDANGEFVLGHIPEGTCDLTAQKEGWLPGAVRGIQVRRGATTGGFEFKLDRAPAISGIAVDEAGVPQVGVHVTGRPVDSGRGAITQTKDDGTFTLFLMQNGPHLLEVGDQSDYEPWGGLGSSGAVFEAGQSDVRIVLKRAARFTFRVVDAGTGAPVERFGIAIERIPTQRFTWGRFSETPELEDHPGGTVERGATPSQQEVGIVAPGYAPLQAPVASDPGASLVQTLRLARGGTISGRITVSDRPLPNAVLLLAGDRVKIDPSLPDADFELLDTNKRLDVSELAAREQQFATDTQGAIRIDGLAAGTYRLTITARGAAHRELRGIAVAEARTRDLGNIQLEPESTIHGRVVLKPGLPVPGLRVWLESGDRMTSVSLDGSFSFEGVESGEHVLRLVTHPPEVLESVSRSVTVAPGASAEVVFDLTASAPCKVELTILESGRAASGLTARWVVATDGFDVDDGDLGKSDSQGLARGTCPNDFNVRFDVLSPAGLRLGRSRDTPSLSAGGSCSETIDLKVGTLSIVLPANLEVPESGCVDVLLEAKETESNELQNVKCCTPGSPDQSPGAPMWKEHRLELGKLRVGEYHATVGKHRALKRDVPGKEAWISIAIGRSFEGDIKIEEGKATIIEVP
ncbi:MAG TPA: carboxypeptidase-like regulatory domain-containing protein [Planctomycetota bacterium]|jgi:hypothetical protein|nr:carboxypeptidase-like regulatory domain-containing protein [Planctomycetota bacterium]